MSSDPTPDREQLIESTERHLTRTGSPKLQVFGLLTLTGAAGFLVSAGLLRAGLAHMPVRYPLAVLAAYGVFLLLLWSWLRVQALGDPAGAVLPAGVTAAGLAPCKDPNRPALARTRAARQSDGSAWSFWDWAWPDFGGDDGCAVVVVVLLIIAAVGSAVVACAWLVADAPVLLAELLVDGAILAAVAPGVHRADWPHWLGGVVRRTWGKALGLMLIFSLVGLALASVEPGARTMGEAFRMARAEPRR